MPERRRKVVSSKRLLLWESMLREYDYPDLEVVGLMKRGVSLAGQVPVSGVFDPKFVPFNSSRPNPMKAEGRSWKRCRSPPPYTM